MFYAPSILRFGTVFIISAVKPRSFSFEDVTPIRIVGLDEPEHTRLWR